MRKLLFINMIIVGLLAAPAFGAFWGNIPQKTLQIAQENLVEQDIDVSQTPVVRVGIGSQNFSSYEWSQAGIYGTGEFEVYNNKTYINTYDRENVININMSGKIFVLTDVNNQVVAKVSGPIIFKSDFGLFGVKNLKRAGKDALYRGNIELVPAASSGKFHIINSLYVEDYLKGVVPNEMPVSFGLEALKAQAVAARNYVLSPRVKANANYDVVDSVASQVYYGANTEKELSNRAVRETAGLVALYDWNLILAQYSSTAGGYTESYHNAFSTAGSKNFPSEPKPYLMAQPDYSDFQSMESEEAAAKFYKSRPKSFDVNSSYYRWQREWTAAELQKEIQDHIAAQSAAGFVTPVVKPGTVIDKITGIKVLQRGPSGKIISLSIQTPSQNYVVKKELVIRRLFTVKGKALPSANLVFEPTYDKSGKLLSMKAYGGGYGHGVGMSQYGAGYMATTLKSSFDEILKHYYSGISIGTVPFILSNHKEQKKHTQSFYSNSTEKYLVVDNKYGLKTLNTNINGIDEKIVLDPTQRFNRIPLGEYLRVGGNTIIFEFPENEGNNKALRIYVETVEKDECGIK